MDVPVLSSSFMHADAGGSTGHARRSASPEGIYSHAAEPHHSPGQPYHQLQAGKLGCKGSAADKQVSLAM